MGDGHKRQRKALLEALYRVSQRQAQCIAQALDALMMSDRCLSPEALKTELERRVDAVSSRQSAR